MEQYTLTTFKIANFLFKMENQPSMWKDYFNNEINFIFLRIEDKYGKAILGGNQTAYVNNKLHFQNVLSDIKDMIKRDCTNDCEVKRMDINFDGDFDFESFISNIFKVKLPEGQPDEFGNSIKSTVINDYKINLNIKSTSKHNNSVIIKVEKL